MKDEKKTFKIRPVANLKRMAEILAKCVNCDVQLVRDNYGTKSDNPNENYLLGNAFGLARYGVFCNPCSELAVKALQERNEW